MDIIPFLLYPLIIIAAPKPWQSLMPKYTIKQQFSISKLA